MKATNIKLQGIIPATITPMNERYEIVEDDLRRYMEWITRFKIGGLAINVDTGEGPSLTSEERKMVLSVVSSVVKKRIPIVAGVPPSNTEQAVKTALEAKNAGADALLVFPNPAFYGQPLPAELPYLYHKAIADATHLPIVIFQLQPALGGYELTEDILLRLIEIPEVVAIKEALFDARKYTDTLRILRKAARKITVLTGNDNFIAESLILGADGALIGFGTLATDMQVEMYELVKKGRYKEAIEIWERLLPLVDVIFGPPVRDYRARTKVALAIQGVIENIYVRPPLLPVSEDEIEKIKEALKKVGIPCERHVTIKHKSKTI
jgi:4-hydroxy-tetrahydrodipicolinate synthase